MKELIDLGVMVFREKNSRGSFKPHLSVKFRSSEGKLVTFSIDTTRTPSKYQQPDAYLITHAHSDHNGRSAMLSELSVCSDKTALALEIRHQRKYKGRTFKVGDSIELSGVNVRTFPNFHTVGSTSFMWENENGTRILVTGDVKDASMLPGCDVLITEANYGDPGDATCYFDDDIMGFQSALNEKQSIAFGAYAFGKAQRAVEMMRQFGYDGNIAMDEQSLSLTKTLLENAGQLSCIGEDCIGNISVVPPWDLDRLPSGVSKFVMTGRNDYRYPAIQISDHLDARGLVGMVMDLDPEYTVVYHPKGHRPGIFAKHLLSTGFDAASIDRISNVLSNEFM